jgi:monofunctional biosynthetic peptidoglycan transglycosylase
LEQKFPKKKRKPLNLKTLSLIIAGFLVLNVGYYFLFPDVADLKKHAPKRTSFMKYRQQQWAHEGKKISINQQWVPLSRISPYVIKGVIIAEDDKFYKHDGFDFQSIQLAIEKDLKAGKFKLGASTISQQLAKNLYLTPSKNPIRKLKEAVLTWRIERTLPKRRIIELYLNVVEWGNGIFGIEAAARHYFGKSAAGLTPREAARLAAVLPNPIRFNPTSEMRFVVRRSNLIYKLMVRRGIVVEEYNTVMAQAKDSTELPVDTLTPQLPLQPDTMTTDSPGGLDNPDSAVWAGDSL